jgi:hypothetical protein
MLGFGALGESALCEIPGEFSARFDLDRRESGQSVIEIASFIDRALIERLRQFPDDLRRIDRRRFEEVLAELFAGFSCSLKETVGSWSSATLRQSRDGSPCT